tara:strand:- start:346 stop:1605 length:1260 start_codon:yes stop_codon:yes gene_type:complete
MSMILPKEILYSDSLPSLPNETVKTSIVLTPVSGQNYGESSLIQWDLPSRDFLVPSSMYLRMKVKLTAGAGAQIKGLPAATFFNKLEVLFGSQIVESCVNWNQLQNMISNCTLNASQKVGLASAYGYTVVDGKLPCGRVCTDDEEFTVAIPFNCILSNCEKLVPLGLMPNIRIQLLTDTINNIFNVSAGAVIPTNFVLSNVELVYDSINFGNSEVGDAIMKMGENLYLKSQSFSSTGASVASGTSGSLEITYNQRLSSIKSLFALFTGNFTESVNRSFDSYDLTGGGSLQFLVASIPFPARPVSTSNSKSAVLLELKSAVGGIHSSHTDNFSMTPVTFGKSGIDQTSVAVPATFIFGVNTEKMHTNNALLSGVSTQNSAISLRIDCSVPTLGAYTAQLICLYDTIIQINPAERSASVKQ